MEVPSLPGTEDRGAQLAARFRRLAPSFSRARGVHLDMLVRFGEHPVLVRIRDGRVDSAETPSTPLPSCDFSLRASEEAWSRFWQAVPAAGWHDIFALGKRRELSIDGNLQPLMAHLQFIKDLLAVGREAQA
ncbi:hypothetical protein JL37_08735 [Achromobacter sp. RTa]|uniref:hypothetical protein n=1 Tax=Achromobacter sp. RTa TaxID=1532557 RepID=UPI00050F0253|nr:hypothetical protein [Achromobacter sp. RTa]KGD95876.1 hypothetical protein JL37_08735 [Achromobacter sp. RTa]